VCARSSSYPAVHTHGCPPEWRQHHDPANDYAIGDGIVEIFETATRIAELKIAHGFAPLRDSYFARARVLIPYSTLGSCYIFFGVCSPSVSIWPSRRSEIIAPSPARGARRTGSRILNIVETLLI
jgi:hypothetical protein